MVKQSKTAQESTTRKFFECLDIGNLDALEKILIEVIGFGIECMRVTEVRRGNGARTLYPRVQR
jgi:hypothetical protein